jgi:hypothetical protein
MEAGIEDFDCKQTQPLCSAMPVSSRVSRIAASSGVSKSSPPPEIACHMSWVRRLKMPYRGSPEDAFKKGMMITWKGARAISDFGQRTAIQLLPHHQSKN